MNRIIDRLSNLLPVRAARWATAALLLAVGANASAQCVSLTTLGSAATQSFDTLSNTAGSTTNNLTITGWFLTEAGGGARDNEQYAVDTGGSNTGDTFSYGAAGNTERALGGLQSGTLISTIGACFTNNSGATVTSLDLAYIGEQWRIANTAAARDDRLDFQYSLDATSLVTGTWVDVNALDFVNPIKTAGTAGALDGNAAANRTAISQSIPSLSIANGATFWIRWNDLNASGADDGLAVDSFSLTPQGGLPTPVLSIGDVALVEGDPPGTTTFTFAVTLSAPAGAGGVTFDVATADGTAQDDNPVTEDNDYVALSLTGQNIPAGSTGPFNVNVTVNRDTVPEPNETFFVNVTNITGANAGDAQGQGTIGNDDVSVIRIHDVQGNGASTPIPGTTVTVEGIVIADLQGTNQLSGFFLQEEDADLDADPQTSEGIFVACGACVTAVAEGQRVRATGDVFETNGMTTITASIAGSVVVTDAGNNLAQVTPTTIDLPIAGVVNDFYEAREGMRVSFVDTLTVSEYFELGRYGHIVLYEGGRPRQFTEANPPSVAGLAAHQDNLSRREVVLDDDNNAEQWFLPPTGPADGLQFVYHPRANGGLSVGTQGVDFFRGGDLVNGLTGVLHWDFAGGTTVPSWRLRPTAATPVTFTAANPRPATPPNVGGAITVAGMNLLNYFTTIDTTPTNSGPCGPGGTLDCRGADSTAELNRQRERVSIVICALDADIVGLAELENTTPSAAITDLLGAVNTRCGGANPYAFVNTGGTLGTDAVRVQQIYRTGVVSPVGAPLSDLDPVHNRPPTAQTFDVVEAANAAFGQRFTVVMNHLRAKGCPGSGGDADAGDGQSCFNATRVAQANRTITWLNTTVLPAAGDPDVLLLGDFNAYAREDPVTAITGAGYTDLETAFQGANAYSYLFDGQLGHVDYAFASASLVAQVTGTDAWHINADEVPLFDINDEIRDTGEASFEEKPDGSALVPPRLVFQPASPYRAADHDPILVGLFAISDLSITKTDSPDPVTAGSNLNYTITVTNNGPDAASNASWNDTLPAGTTFVSLPPVAGWSCTTPAIGAAGTIACSNPNLAVGSAVFTLTVNVAGNVAAGTVLSNTATVTSASGDGDPANNSATATTTVIASADVSVTKTDSPDPVSAGNNLTYQITLTNSGPSNAASATFADTLPAGTSFVSLSTSGGWSCTTPAVGAGGTVSCTHPSFGVTADVFTLLVNVDAGVAAGTVISNTATIESASPDPNPGNESATATTTVTAEADVSIAVADAPDPVAPGTNLSYTITVANAGPSSASTVEFDDTLPTGTTFVSLTSPGGWTCATPAVGAGGNVSCSIATQPVGSEVFTLVVLVDGGVAAGTVLSNTAAITSFTTDPSPGNESATATTTVGAGSADVSIAIADAPDPVAPGTNLTYTITVANAGPSSATTVAFADTLPVGTSFVSLTSPGGWSCTTPAVGAGGTVSCSIATLATGNAVFTLVVTVDAGLATGTTIDNTVDATSASTDPNPGNESASAQTTVGSGSADVSATITDAPDPVAPGANLSYAITVANAGPSAATTATLVDALPAGTTFVSLTSAAGWSCTTPAVGAGGSINCSIASLGVGASDAFTLVVAVDGATAPGSTISNTAIAGSATTDPTSGNESASTTTTVGAGSADLSVAIVDAPDPVTPGTNLVYTITATNAGPASAANATLADTLPANTSFVSLVTPAGWSCTTPAVGASGAIACSNANFGVGNAVFTLTVAVDAAASGTLGNTATVASATADPNAANDSATATTTLGAGSADVSVTKTAATSVAPGAALSYTIVVANAGPVPATGVALADALPANTTFASLTAAAGWTCTTPAVGSGGSVNCTLASMPIGSASFTLAVNVAASAPGGSTIANTATVASTSTDAVPGNNSATANTTVTAPTLVVGSKSVSGSRTPGGALTYSIVLSNTGGSAQANNPGDEFTDVLPASLALVSATATSGTAVATVGTNTVTWNGSLAAGATVTITIQATVRSSAAVGSTITNQGTISFDADGNGTNEASAVTDDPGTGATGDGTSFTVLPGGVTPAAPLLVPATSLSTNLLLAVLMAMLALVTVRRRIG